MIILGIDPGSRVTGYGVLETRGNQLKYISAGAFVLHKENDFAARLALLWSELECLIKSHQPDAISLEKAFFGVNVRSALLLGQVRGCVLTFAGHFGIPIAEYSATEVKKAVTGYGRAEKNQMQEMVRILLSLPTIPKPHDAADALGLAICHAHSRPVYPLP